MSAVQTMAERSSELELRPSEQTQFIHALRAKLNLPNIPALDGMRAVAVFLVIIYHFGFDRVPGGLGVLIFFVLSGFLITWLLLKENDSTGQVSIRGFYIRRALRIFPAFYCFWLGTVALLAMTHRHIDWPHAFSALFYTSNYYQGIVKPPDSFVSHTWSLAIEEQFYLVWPGIFYAFRKRLKALTLLTGTIIVCAWTWRLALQFVLHVNQSYIYRAFETRIDHLMVGCLLALLIRQGTASALLSKCCRYIWAPLVPICLLFISACVFGQSPDYRDSIGFIVEPLLIAALLVQLIYFESTALWKWTNISALRWLGRISYSLYLYQQITLHPAHRLLSRFPVVIQLLAGIAFTIVMASASFYLVEKYFLQLKRRFAPAAARSSRREVISVNAPSHGSSLLEVAK
ncbi:MAG: acyltransferase [Candidatus Angelobacter sp. Gp1-AA117]|nr:MAG: acyltransferase [Candidatus Angelobacter sp. Gp1-AA117]